MTRPEIESLEAFDAHVASCPSLSGMVLQSVNLRDRADALRHCTVIGAMFLGCDLTEAESSSLRDRGALLFPALPNVPVDPYRGSLYDAQSLYAPLPNGNYADCLDARVYAWTLAYRVPRPITVTLTMSLHDHAVTDALLNTVQDAPADSLVGVMGGHALRRGESAYREATELGARLAATGRTVLSGGGPGAMEAANLGAYLADHPSSDRDAACDALSAAPDFAAGIDDWARVALDVRSLFGDGHPSLGIPTWFYGHEPPNVFATGIAKYFSNAIREDMLLTLCRGGILYLPGAAGTVQELFQAVTENYYAKDPADIAPLVLVGHRHWTDTLPAWPLLRRLAAGRPMASRIFLVDTIDEAFEAVTSVSPASTGRRRH